VRASEHTSYPKFSEKYIKFRKVFRIKPVLKIRKPRYNFAFRRGFPKWKIHQRINAVQLIFFNNSAQKMIFTCKPRPQVIEVIIGRGLVMNVSGIRVSDVVKQIFGLMVVKDNDVRLLSLG
jgi:hypothetical protein